MLIFFAGASLTAFGDGLQAGTHARTISMGDVPHTKPTVPKGPSKTIITSQALEMVSGTEENTFYFSKDVHVVGTNLNMTADQIVVTAARDQAVDPANVAKALPSGSSQHQMGTIHKIIAIGNVHILQEGRESVSNRADFFPKENKVVLTENPRVIDSQAIVSGWRITLYQGERRVMVEQDPNAPAVKPTVDLEALPDMGFDPQKQPTIQTSADSNHPLTPAPGVGNMNAGLSAPHPASQSDASTVSPGFQPRVSIPAPLIPSK